MDNATLELLDCDVNEREENKKFNFSQLPWVIFLSVLEFFNMRELCRLCLVNKLWCKACRDQSLWRYVDLKDCSGISDEDLCRITSFSENVLSLKITDCNNVTDVGVSCVMKQCATLVELTVIHRELSDVVLESVGKYCLCLRKLNISLSLKFTDVGLKKVFEGCHELEEVILDQCKTLTNESLVSLARHCPKLKSLSTEGILNVTDDGVVSLVHGCATLTTLRVPFCGVTSQCIPHIVQCCQSILWLDFRDVSSLDDDDICRIVESCKKLECLNLGLCYNLTDKAALNISRNCKSLKYLFLVRNKITDQGLYQLGQHCANLLRLDVSWCAAITDKGATDVLLGCKNLIRLGLTRCDKVSKSAVMELSSRFPRVFISSVYTEIYNLSKKDTN